jgi:hypothetical protein
MQITFPGAWTKTRETAAETALKTPICARRATRLAWETPKWPGKDRSNIYIL